MGTNLPEQHMLDQTLAAFAGGQLATISPTEANALITGWIDALEGDPNVEPIKQALQKLNDTLQNKHPNPEHIRPLLTSMAAQAADIAQGPYAEGNWTGKLESLAKMLGQFGRDL